MPGKFDQESFDRDTLTVFISSYPRALVMDVIKTLCLEQHKDRRANGWKLFTGTDDEFPANMHRMKVKGLWYVRAVDLPITEHAAASEPGIDRGAKPHRQKTDTTVRKTDMLCPVCKSQMFREPICRGCKEGKAGYRVRLICGENDEHTWIV